MKSILLIVVSFCISTTLFAQDANYTGPAKTYVTGFYKQAEEAKKSIETQKCFLQHGFNGSRIKKNKRTT